MKRPSCHGPSVRRPWCPPEPVWVAADESSGRRPRGSWKRRMASRAGMSPPRMCPHGSARGCGSRRETIDPLPSKGLRPAERIRRTRNVDLLVAWSLIACQPFRCGLIPCCYTTGMERRCRPYVRRRHAARAAAAPAIRRGARPRSAAVAHPAGPAAGHGRRGRARSWTWTSSSAVTVATALVVVVDGVLVHEWYFDGDSGRGPAARQLRHQVRAGAAGRAGRWTAGRCPSSTPASTDLVPELGSSGYARRDACARCSP